MNFQNWKLSQLFSIIILLLFFSGAVTAQFEIPKKPTIESTVYDYAGLLYPYETELLEEILTKHLDSTGNKIVVVIVESIHGANIKKTGREWKKKWNVSENEKGTFILLAVNEQKIFISPGYGLKHLLTPAIITEIIQNDVETNFYENGVSNGLIEGIYKLMDVFNGTYTATVIEVEPFPWIVLIFPLIPILIFILIIYLGGKDKNGKYMTFSGSGQSSGGSSSFGGRSSGRSSGGFSGGFGGGGFSGGGAGGSW